MNGDEAAKRIRDAGISFDDMHSYTFDHLKIDETEYSEEEVARLIEKVNNWKERTKTEWESKELKK